mmetsp:Transcript_18604/g.25902  ORF Transcript_18604/g.25902 Transcript_18604/m.25902 type:complete len:208 (+) Transcript_18604:75-698(+)
MSDDFETAEDVFNLGDGIGDGENDKEDETRAPVDADVGGGQEDPAGLHEPENTESKDFGSYEGPLDIDDAKYGEDIDSNEGGPFQSKDMSNSAYSEWEEKQHKLLRDRADDERKKKKEILEKGEESIKKFYEERADALKKTQEENAQLATEKAGSYKHIFETGTKWQKVGRLLDLKPNSERNVERMRKLLTALKNGSGSEKKQGDAS